MDDEADRVEVWRSSGLVVDLFRPFGWDWMFLRGNSSICSPILNVIVLYILRKTCRLYVRTMG